MGVYSTGSVLNDALFEHSGSDLHEAGDVGALHVVDVAVGLFAVLHASLVDGRHDEVELCVNLFTGPAEVSGVLSHFETGSGNTTGVHSLARSEEDACRLECVDGFRCAAHV